MTDDEKKAMAAKLLHGSSSGDVEAVRSVINKDFTFRFMQQAQTWEADGIETSATLDHDNYLKSGVPICNEITRDGMHFTIELIVLEGNWMAVFGHSNATSLKGKPYNNEYCWRIRFSGTGVSELREYCDTKLAYDVLFE